VEQKETEAEIEQKQEAPKVLWMVAVQPFCWQQPAADCCCIIGRKVKIFSKNEKDIISLDC
jgi:hypothetical protein